MFPSQETNLRLEIAFQIQATIPRMRPLLIRTEPIEGGKQAALPGMALITPAGAPDCAEVLFADLS
jgi:hypothetical protein